MSGLLAKLLPARAAATAIPATPATDSPRNGDSVAKIAKVAVASPPSGDPGPPPADDEQRIRAWIASTGEADAAQVERTVQACREDAASAAYLLECWNERSAIREFDGGADRDAAEVAAALDLGLDPATVRRQDQAAQVLREHPERTRHIAFDPDAEPGAVIGTVAIRLADGGIAVCEMRLPADRYDPFLIVGAMQRADQ
jgi:hypothetical protein